MSSSKIRNELAELYDDPEMLFLDADYMDEAIVGVALLDNLPIVVYDVEKIVKALMENSDMDEEGAYEYFGYNIQGAYVGPRTPLYLEGI